MKHEDCAGVRAATENLTTFEMGNKGATNSDKIDQQNKCTKFFNILHFNKVPSTAQWPTRC